MSTSKPAYTRREFLGSLAVVSTAATVPMFLERSAFAAAPTPGSAVRSQPGVPEDRILVVVQLSGGNDGLNALPPFGMRDYYTARPFLAVKESDAIKLGSNAGIGLHPELVDLKAMIDEGLAAVIQGVGYPNPNRSHFASMDIWHTADPTGRGAKGLGWVGRTMDELAVKDGKAEATACVCIGQEMPLAAQGRSVKAVTFENANLFRWIGGELHPALSEPYNKLNRSVVAPTTQPVAEAAGDQSAFILRTAMDAQVASDRIRAAVARGPETQFPGGRLADQLRMVASMIRAGLPTRVYYVTLGGFDTHAGQPYAHGRLLREFASGVRAFYRELSAIGQRSRVLTLAFSEFGRRVEQNASNGTDHGTAGPAFVFGEMIRKVSGGLIGNHPSLTELDEGDLIHTADFRNVYAAVLQNWMKVDPKKVLGAPFRPAEILKKA